MFPWIFPGRKTSIFFGDVPLLCWIPREAIHHKASRTTWKNVGQDQSSHLTSPKKHQTSSILFRPDSHTWGVPLWLPMDLSMLYHGKSHKKLDDDDQASPVTWEIFSSLLFSIEKTVVFVQLSASASASPSPDTGAVRAARKCRAGRGGEPWRPHGSVAAAARATRWTSADLGGQGRRVNKNPGNH